MGIVSLGWENFARNEHWKSDGPFLPIEFARESKEGA